MIFLNVARCLGKHSRSLNQTPIASDEVLSVSDDADVDKRRRAVKEPRMKTNKASCPHL